LSANTILHLEKTYPRLRYVGSDGWGDGNVGYFNKYGFQPTTEGLCVRPEVPVERMMELTSSYSVQHESPSGYMAPFPSIFLIQRFLDSVTSELCRSRPRSRAQFVETIAAKPTDSFRKRIGSSVFFLKKGEIRHGYISTTK
jgi:hypothetical protein